MVCRWQRISFWARGILFGLFMPLAYLFPRWRWPLMLTPWFIAVARINANDHFISDVAASIVLVGVITLILAGLTKQRKGPNNSGASGFRVGDIP